MNQQRDDTFDALEARARRAYELGRLQTALVHAAVLALATTLAASFLFGTRAWLWAPLTLVVWSTVWWRGGVLLASARYGLVAGAITSLLPLSLLRPCCRLGNVDMAATCTMPQACVLAGALVGVPLAGLVMRRHADRPLEAALGMALGALLLGTLKCTALFVGEGIGLVAGIALGISATAAWNASLLRRAS